MAPYIIITVVLTFLAVIDVSYLTAGPNIFKIYIKPAIMFAVAVFLTLFAGLRYRVGPDYGQYLDFFQTIAKFRDFSDMISEPFISGIILEKGYVIYNYLCKDFGFHFFLTSFALIAIGLKYTFIHQYAKFPLYSLALLFVIQYLTQDFGQIRQGFATGITIWSIHYIVKKKFIQFLFLVLIASAFHYSALIFLSAYFFDKLNLRYWLLFILICIFQFVIKSDYLLILMAKFTYSPAINAKIASYAHSAKYGGELAFSLGNLFRIFLSGYLVLNERMLKQDRVLHLFATLYLWGYLIFCLFSFNTIFAARLNLYFRIVEVLLIPNILFLYRKEVVRYTLAYVVALCYLCLQEYKQLSDAASYGFYNNYQMSLKDE
ncbi:MAG: EpsG family protein [Mucilaginibacter polytrichastri]|nr:EpsG family protein [Mucilaginibacter polytrichastri]